MSEPKVFGARQEGIAYLEREGAYGIAFKDGHVLIEKARLGYFLPGGGIEEGESPEEALVREMLEETGYELASHRLVGTAIEYTGDWRNHGYYFLVELGAKGKPTYADGHVMPVEWTPLAEAKEHMHLRAQEWAIEQAHSSFK